MEIINRFSSGQDSLPMMMMMMMMTILSQTLDDKVRCDLLRILALF